MGVNCGCFTSYVSVCGHKMTAPLRRFAHSARSRRNENLFTGEAVPESKVSRMPKTFALLILLGLAGTSIAAAAAAKSDSDLQKEYVQVRKIALKDAKVQDAFEKANARLDDRILEIDPALKPIVERGHGKPAESVRSTVERHPSQSSAPKVSQNEHIVVKGETLTSIAEHHKVTVAALKDGNHITDERKLHVGQKLIIPASGKPTPHQSTAAKPHQEPKPADTGGWWSDLKKDL
jgi:LysM repeat protein